jgi:hypothetical protein
MEIAPLRAADLTIRHKPVVAMRTKMRAEAAIGIGEATTMLPLGSNSEIGFSFLNLLHRSTIVRKPLRFQESTRLHLCLSIHCLPRISKVNEGKSDGKNFRPLLA